jgi:hypothetical protein
MVTSGVSFGALPRVWSVKVGAIARLRSASSPVFQNSWKARAAFTVASRWLSEIEVATTISLMSTPSRQSRGGQRGAQRGDDRKARWSTGHDPTPRERVGERTPGLRPDT